MGRGITLVKALEWLSATVIVAASTVFAVMRFAYSDFETRRDNDVYRSQIEKRLDDIRGDIKNVNDKLDRLIERRK